MEIIFWILGVWGILGFFLLLNIVEMHPAEKCSTRFKVVWLILCGPVSWGISIVLLAVAFYITATQKNN